MKIEAYYARSCRASITKMLLLMKLTAILVLSLCLQVRATGYSQSVTLSLQNAPLQKVFAEITRQTGYQFIYTSWILRMAPAVDISVKEANLTQTLAVCFKDLPLTYHINDRFVVVALKERKPDGDKIPVDLAGRVVNDKGTAVTASIMIKGTKIGTTTNENGEFSLQGVAENAILVISAVSFETQEVKVNGRKQLTVVLQLATNSLDSFQFSYNTGYQNVPKERATGSFVQINNELLNRSVSTNILDRLDGVTSGLIFTKNKQGGMNQSDIAIRGRSTLYANPNPLIVLDNYPYEGDLSNINPNDIENITVLKDAAAASIWGSYSGNGVIVITTKKGQYNQCLKVGFNSNVTISEKPDLFYRPRMATNDLIDMEQFLFDKGSYNGSISNFLRPYLSPIVEILVKKKNNQLTAEEAKAQIDVYRSVDNRYDIEKYAYRNSINQQYAINFSGGTPLNKYYFSAGFDNNLAPLKSDDFKRATITAMNTLALIPKKLELETSILFSTSIRHSPSDAGVNFGSIYMPLTDAKGNPSATSAALRQPYVDTTGKGLLLDWNYRPLDELRLSNNKTEIVDYRMNVGVKYNVLPGLEATIRYQYSKGVSERNDLRSQETYYTRNLINQFSQINFVTGSINRPVPLGGILLTENNNYTSHNARGQLNFNRQWEGDHLLSAIAGIEIRTNSNQSSRGSLYGYDEDLQSNIIVDYVNRFPLYYFPFLTDKIPLYNSRYKAKDNNFSYYANAAYTYKDRYTVSVSGRKDASNIYGVDANQKGVPLMSIGASWLISKEGFYDIAWLNFLKFRITNGYNGNVDKSTSAYVTSYTSLFNTYGAPTQVINNPPNPALQWERVKIVNAAIDFSLFKDVVTGSFEYYWKTGKDLIADMPMSPSSGVSQFRGNVANIKGKGFDFTLNTKNLKGKISWLTTVLISRTTDRVEQYKIQPKSSSLISPISLVPMEGKPLYSVWSYSWAGLDPQTGDPQGYVDGKVSKDWGKIVNADYSTYQYHGPANPTYFGSIRNSVGFKQFQLSFNVTFKAGYYFKRTSYEQAYFYADYTHRWLQPGDEKFTQVPSFVYPDDTYRRSFYQYSSALVERGDHVRLQDIQLSYDWRGKRSRTIPSIRVYAYCNNVGLLWKANDHGIDPDVVPGVFIFSAPNPRTFAAGVKVDF